MILLFRQKMNFFFEQIWLSKKQNFSLKKMIFILENMVFLLIEKLKMIKKSLLRQIRIEKTSTINVNNTSNKFLIISFAFFSLFCKKLRSRISRAKSFSIYIIERVSRILCTFMETFICVFKYFFPMKKTKKQKQNKKTVNLMYRIEIWLVFKLSG